MIFIELHQRTANLDWEAAKRTYTRSWDVTADCSDDESDIYAAGVHLGAAHPSDTLARCTKVSITQTLPNLWKYNANYATLSPEQQEKVDNPAPQDRATIWKGSFSKQEVFANKDLSTPPKPYVNSAGDPFAEALPTYQGQATFSGTRNYLTFDFDNLVSWQWCVNNAVWMTLPQYSVRLDGVEWSQKKEQLFGSPWSEVTYYEVTFNFTCNKKLWIPTKVIDKGYRSLQGSPLELRQIRDTRTGQIRTEPSLLDGSGVLLDDGLSPVELEFVQYYTLDFTTFGL